MSLKGDRQAVIKALAKRNGPGCIYCRSPLTDPTGGRQEPTTRTVDHIIPRSKGGTGHIRNLALACARCNGIKADRMPLDFIHERNAR